MPKSKHHPKRRIAIARIGVAALIAFVAMPTMLTGYLRSIHSIDDDGQESIEVADQARRARKDRVARRLQERRYWGAMRVYRDLVALDVKGLPVPDVNDPATLDIYYDADYVAKVREEGVHTAAPEEGKSAAEAQPEIMGRYNALSERYRDLLDGFVYHTGLCPVSLKSYAKNVLDDDLYDICVKLLVHTKKERRIERRTTPLSGYVQGRLYVPLRDRLRQMERAMQLRGSAPKPPNRTQERMEFIEEQEERLSK